MPSPKDRQTSGISMSEKQRAELRLRAALNSLRVYHANTTAPVQSEIATAMGILGMSENTGE